MLYGYYAAYQTGVFNQWAALGTGTRLGFLQLDNVLRSTVHILVPTILRSQQHASVGELMLSCLQAHTAEACPQKRQLQLNREGQCSTQQQLDSELDELQAVKQRLSSVERNCPPPNRPWRVLMMLIPKQPRPTPWRYPCYSSSCNAAQKVSSGSSLASRQVSRSQPR